MSFVEKLLAAYVPSPEAVVVDVGCGEQPYRASVAARYVGVDRHGNPDVRAEADDLPFDDGSVDLVFSVGAFYQFPDSERALAEFVRVLRAGGRVLLFDYNRRSQRRLERLEAASRPRWTALGLGRRLRKAGFTRVQLLVPLDQQPHGVSRLARLAAEEVMGQWAIVTGIKP